jgi:hypothetical protein
MTHIDTITAKLAAMNAAAQPPAKKAKVQSAPRTTTLTSDDLLLLTTRRVCAALNLGPSGITPESMVEVIKKAEAPPAEPYEGVIQ